MTGFSTFTYAKKYSVSSEIEFVTEPDLEFGETYKPPDDLINLLADNLVVYDKVGIGTTNPQTKLHVAGDTLITGISTLGLGTIISAPSKSQLTFELMNDTTLIIRVRGNDDVLRSANIILT